VTEIISVEDQQAGPEAMAFTTTSLFTRRSRDDSLEWTGNLPLRLALSMAVSGDDVRELLDGNRGRLSA
jgi:hypothetical protein